MAGNIFGQVFRLTTFGESHGAAVGGIIEGCPAGLRFDYDLVRAWMNRRRPGQSEITTGRNETDEVEWLSGIHDGITIGTPIAFIIRNDDARPSDYDALKDVFRPSHGDYTYHAKYGLHDHRGGGRASARETAARVAAGAVAMMLLYRNQIEIKTFATSIGYFEVAYPDWLSMVDDASISETGYIDSSTAEAVVDYLKSLKEQGDSTGGKVSCRVRACPPGLGEPVFDKLNARLSAAMMSLPAAKGIEFGSGMAACSSLGSLENDPWTLDDHNRPITVSNRSGGIMGGISTGEDITFTVGFKPASSIGKPQKSITKDLSEVEVEIKGRHDPCVVPRAIVVVEAMTALVLADMLLLNKLSKI